MHSDGVLPLMATHSTSPGLRAERTGIVIRPDPRRVLFRPFGPGTQARATKIVARVMALTEEEVRTELSFVMSLFEERHLGLRAFLLRRFEENRHLLFSDQPLSEQRQLLIGSYFTQEYSHESSALFNPSMIWHPDQSGVEPGQRRFILSLRATGEGHVSSLVFRSGTIDAEGTIRMTPASRFVTTPDVQLNATYEKTLFTRKLVEVGLVGPIVDTIFQPLSERFTFSELSEQVRTALRQGKLRGPEPQTVAEGILSLAESNYEIQFTSGQKLSERIIFPVTPNEVKGIEDARFVEFVDDDGEVTYYAIYTAYDGRVFFPQLLETKDFLHFRSSTLNGPEVQNKGLALFPRRIDGRYAVLSRQDNENIYLMFSDNVHFWYEKQVLLKPTYPWEFVQLGNCGSPIETEAGWLVLSHGVGAMRRYSISAFLLDLKDPTRVIGRLRHPLLDPDENEREGYVPNVVYSCGAQVHNGRLLIPYAMSDHASSFATVSMDQLLEALTS